MLSSLSIVDACLGRLPRPLQGRMLARLLTPQRLQAAHCMPFRMVSAAAGAVRSPSRLHATNVEVVPAAAEDFYATTATTFSSMGLRDDVSTALQAAGFPRPAHAQVSGGSGGGSSGAALLLCCSAACCLALRHAHGTRQATNSICVLCIQELAVPIILRGRDVVLAAETGSGKTLAYLAPLVDWALRSRAAAAAHAAAEAAATAAGGAAEEPQAQHRRRRHATAALVLCPNAALCEQVLVAAGALRDPASGAPLAAAAFVSAQSPPPYELPDIVVSTPGALVSLLDNGGPSYGYEWTRAGALLHALCRVWSRAGQTRAEQGGSGLSASQMCC